MSRAGSKGPAKAYLALVEAPDSAAEVPKLAAVTAKARSGNLGRIEFMFNPEKLQITKGASWGEPKVRIPVGVQYNGTDPAETSLRILLDHAHKATPTVARDVDLLLRTVVPTRKTKSNHKPTPPWVVFGWGHRVPMVMIVTSVDATYTMFKPDGVATRALIILKMREVLTEPALKQNPTSGGEHPRQQHTLVMGDTLQSVAHQAYGNAARWRQLADVNGIDDPSRLRPGRTLLIPNNAELVDE